MQEYVLKVIKINSIQSLKNWLCIKIPCRMVNISLKQVYVKMNRRSFLKKGIIFGGGLMGIANPKNVHSSNGYSGPVGTNFNGTKFHNQDPKAKRKISDLFKWVSNRTPPKWKNLKTSVFGPSPAISIEPGKLVASFVGHASFLIQTDNINLLTDPIWSERASPVTWAGPKRVRPCAIRFADLPEIDAVLISHNHYDHLDLPTLKRLEKKFSPRYFVPLGLKSFLEDEGLKKVTEMDWWNMAEITGSVKIHAVPAQHFSARGPFDRNTTLWAGFVIESTAGRVFFAGDTGFGPHFEQIKMKFNKINLAILPIGAYKPVWFMSPAHMSPSDALKAHSILKPEMSVAMHYGTFNLADDGQDEATSVLEKALAEKDVDNFNIFEAGKAVQIV